MFDHVDIVETCRKAAGADVTLASDDVLMAAAVGLEHARTAIDAAAAHVLVELERRGATDSETGLTVGTWLSREARLPEGSCKVRVRAARRIAKTLPLVDAALMDGTIRWDHARILERAANPRIADAIAELSPHLIELAGLMTFDAWAREVRNIADRLDADGGYDPESDRERNRLHLRPVGTGMVQISGLLVGALALSVRQLVEAEADRQFRAHRDTDQVAGHETGIPARSELMADALGELCRNGSAIDEHTTRPPEPEAILILHPDLPDEAVTLDGQRIPAAAIIVLGCAMTVTPLVIDGHGAPLYMGDRIRLANRAQRRALAVRDGGCVFPGCNRPVNWTDAHHVDHPGQRRQPHSDPDHDDHDHDHDQHRTDIDNLALLCRLHHGVTHRKGWQMHATPDQWFWWQTPTGRTFWSQRHQQQRAGPTPAAA